MFRSICVVAQIELRSGWELYQLSYLSECCPVKKDICRLTVTCLPFIVALCAETSKQSMAECVGRASADS